MRSICFSYFFFFIQFRSEEIYLFAHRKSHSMRWVVSHALGTAILARFYRCVWGVWDVGACVWRSATACCRRCRHRCRHLSLGVASSHLSFAVTTTNTWDNVHVARILRGPLAALNTNALCLFVCVVCAVCYLRRWKIEDEINATTSDM